MKITTKTLTHYIINASVILIAVGVLVLTWAMPAGIPKTWVASMPFITLLLISLITVITSSLVLANDKSKPHKVLLPSFISALVIATIGTIMIVTYHSTFDIEAGHNNLIINYPLKAVLCIILALSYTLMILIISIYITKFNLAAVSGDIATEWTIKNSFSLIKNKADIKHLKEFSYIYSEGKILVIRFITEEQDPRLIVFEEQERNLKTPIIIKIENEINRLRSSNANVVGAIILLSNILPKEIGKSKNIFLIKNKDLFEKYKNIKPLNNIGKDIIEGVIE